MVLIGHRATFLTQTRQSFATCDAVMFSYRRPSRGPRFVRARSSAFSHDTALKGKICRATGNAQLSVCARGAAQLCSAGTKRHVVLEPQQRAKSLFLPFCCTSEDKHLEALTFSFTFNPLRLFTPR